MCRLWDERQEVQAAEDGRRGTHHPRKAERTGSMAMAGNVGNVIVYVVIFSIKNVVFIATSFQL